MSSEKALSYGIVDEIIKSKINMNKEKIIVCSFCNSSQDKLDFLVEGNNAYICNMCIQKA